MLNKHMAIGEMLKQIHAQRPLPRPGTQLEMFCIICNEVLVYAKPEGKK